MQLIYFLLIQNVKMNQDGHKGKTQMYQKSKICQLIKPVRRDE